MSDADLEVALYNSALAAAAKNRADTQRILQKHGHALRSAVREYLASPKNNCGNGGPAHLCHRPDWCNRCPLREASDR